MRKLVSMHFKTTSLFLFILLLATQSAFIPMFLVPLQVSLRYNTMTPQQGSSFRTPVQSADIRFGFNTRVTDGTSPYPEQVEPTLTILSSGRLLIGWKEADTFNGPGLRVGFRYSDDEGRTFSPSILMEPLGPGESQSDPWLISDNADNAYYTFLEYGGSGEGMGVAKTTDGGLTWNPPTQASDTPGYLDDKETACVDANGNIYLMWDYFITSDSADLVFTKSTNGGISFQPTQVIGPWETHGGIPYLTCTPNGTLFVSTILDSVPSGPIDTIFFMKSTDYGASWTSPIRVNPVGFGEIAIISVCDTDSNNHIYICFAAGSSNDKEVYVTKSIDGGTTWENPVQVNDVSSNMQRMVEMHIDANDNIHVAWLDARNAEWDIYYSYSSDGGTTFSEDVRITTEGFPLTFTRPGDYFTLRSGPSGKLYIVWTDGRAITDQDIYLAKQDLAAPLVSNIPLAPPSQFQTISFRVEASDDDHVEFVELSFQVDEGFIHHLQMHEVSEDIYQAIVPGSMIIGNMLKYHFRVNDTAGRSTRLPANETEFFIIPINAFPSTLFVTIAVGSVVIILVIIFSVWYLRRDKSVKVKPNSES